MLRDPGPIWLLLKQQLLSCAREGCYWREPGPEMHVEMLQKTSSLRRGPPHPLKFLTERIHPGQLVESNLSKSHFTGYPHENLCLKFRLNQAQTASVLEFTTNTNLCVNAEKSLKITTPYTTSCIYSEKLLQLSQFLEGSDICCAQRWHSKTINVCNGVKYSALPNIFKVSHWQLHTSLHLVSQRRACSGIPCTSPSATVHESLPVSVVLCVKKLLLGVCWELSRDQKKKVCWFQELSLVDPSSRSAFSCLRPTTTFNLVKRFPLKISRVKTFRQCNFCTDMTAYLTRNRKLLRYTFAVNQLFSSPC